MVAEQPLQRAEAQPSAPGRLLVGVVVCRAGLAALSTLRSPPRIFLGCVSDVSAGVWGDMWQQCTVGGVISVVTVTARSFVFESNKALRTTGSRVARGRTSARPQVRKHTWALTRACLFGHLADMV